MHEATTVTEVLELLSSFYESAGIIGIDGTDGVGKTTLAKELGEAIGATVVSLDEFVIQNRGRYVPNLRTKDLRGAVSSAPPPIIVEGVCLLAALARLSLEADVLIYIKRISDYDYWYDEDTCDAQEDEETLIAHLSRDAAEFAKLDPEFSGEPAPVEGDSGLTPLREEIVRYHCQYRPSRRAQIVFLQTAAA